MMASKSKRQHSILLIDDSVFVRKVMQQQLEQEGYQVKLASTANEGLDIVENQVLDLVILDVMLPDVHGYDICRLIKSSMAQKGQFLPVIMLTSISHVEDKVAGLESGADDYLVKPLSQAELLARVRGMLRIRDLQEDVRQAHESLSHAHAVIERELKIIGDIQRSFLPQSFPTYPGFSISASYYPSMMAGGDYYDVIVVDDQHWGFVIADIAGHGASAAVVMALTQMTVKEFAPGITSPCEALRLFNRKLEVHLSADYFVTMFYAVLNLQTMKFVYASAGHNPVLFYSFPKNQVYLLQNDFGVPLRTFPIDIFDEREEEFHPGNKLLMFTDGVVDIVNPDKRFYGLPRLMELFKKYRREPGEIIIEKIFQDTEQYRESSKRLDDFTLVLLSRS